MVTWDLFGRLFGAIDSGGAKRPDIKRSQRRVTSLGEHIDADRILTRREHPAGQTAASVDKNLDNGSIDKDVEAKGGFLAEAFKTMDNVPRFNAWGTAGLSSPDADFAQGEAVDHDGRFLTRFLRPRWCDQDTKNNRLGLARFDLGEDFEALTLDIFQGLGHPGRS